MARSGRPRRAPTTRHGKAILRWLDAQEMPISALAERAGMHHNNLYSLLHADVGNITLRTIERLVVAGLPLELLAPSLAQRLTKTLKSA